MLIADGKTGRTAGVNSENRLEVDSVMQTVEHHVNTVELEAYHITFEQASAAGADYCIFYLINNADDDIFVEGFDIYISQACEVYFKLNDTGTPGGSPTAVTPASVNAGSGSIADGTFYQDDNMTGLSGGTEIARYKFIAETATQYFNFECDVIVPKNMTFTIYLDTASTNVIMNIPIYFHGD